MSKSLVWLRRNLRISDNKIISEAAKASEKIYFTFVFDSNILKHFPNKNDRRLSFIVAAIELIDFELRKHGSGLIILFGDPEIEIPKLASKLSVNQVFADLDFEPSSLARDQKVQENLKADNIELKLNLDHLLVHPSRIVKPDGAAYKVFTPFMKAFRASLNSYDYQEYKYNISGKLAEVEPGGFDKKEILKKAGYEYQEDDLWQPENAEKELTYFIENNLSTYQSKRNYLAINGTSRLSPYLRFGIISIRKCFREAAAETINETWINELIWREFYAYIMYHFPNSIKDEFQEKYIGKVGWQNNEHHLQAFYEGKTGFPIIDAAIRQLHSEGWMHNRARMIVASFFTKNLLMDWRIGEKFFGQYLMDYDLASNVGGWQWSASTGTDAQPYFRIFNPMNQGRDYDPEAAYIKKYIPELEPVKVPDIFDGEIIAVKYKIANYPKPIVSYKATREYAISLFKDIK